MKYFRCEFKGEARNEGRFGHVEPGDKIDLSKKEYDSVADDEDFKYIEDVEVERAGRNPGNPVGPPEGSVGNEGKVKEPGTDAVSTDPADGEGDHGEEEVAVDAEYVSEYPEEEDVIEYKDMTSAELKKEIGERNEGREDDQKLSAKGKKKALIETLEADDE